LKAKLLFWSVFIALAVLAGLTRWEQLPDRPLIETDGQGYYAYLPAVFIYHDLQFHFVESVNEKYYEESKRARYVIGTPSGNVNKYFAGTAVLLIPFFLTGCLLSLLMGVPVDGYAWPFQLMVGVAAIVYLMLGNLYLGKLLRQLGFRDAVVLATLLAITFGTNLLYYTVYEPSMSHVYSFFTISAFLYHGRKALLESHLSNVMWASLLFGLTVLIRPVNALVLLALPAVVGGTAEMLVGLGSVLHKRRMALLAVFIVVATVSVQPLLYLLETGRPFVWSYQEEGFHFLRPEILNVLFSYRKGLFVYCPILIIAVLGILRTSIKRKPGALELLVYLALVTWVIASWWMWYYGGSFGHRAFIDHYPLFAIGLAYAFSRGIGVLGPRLLVAALPLFIAVQWVQTYQYVKHILPFDNMNREKYWNLFLRTGDDLAWYYGGYPGEQRYVALDSVLVIHDMESSLGWGNEDQIVNTESHQGQHAALMQAGHQYGITLRKPVDEIGTDVNTVRASVWVRPSSTTTDLSLVCAIEDSTGRTYYWRSRPLRPQFRGSDEWAQASALFRFGPLHPSDRILVYPMRSDRSDVYIDQFEVSFIYAR